MQYFFCLSYRRYTSYPDLKLFQWYAGMFYSSDLHCAHVFINQAILPMFFADDGSSLCCGWADDARAELLLRLQEIVHLDASVNLKLSKGGENSTKLKYTIGCCLEKMLKQHTSVTVKNCGIPPDFYCRDLDASSVSDKALSRLEDKLLKFIVLNACCKGSLVSLSIHWLSKHVWVWIDYLARIPLELMNYFLYYTIRLILDIKTWHYSNNLELFRNQIFTICVISQVICSPFLQWFALSHEIYTWFSFSLCVF